MQPGLSVAVADSAPKRMKGLLGRDSLPENEGLLLRPAGSVHTAFMRFPIDVVFLDSSDQVLDVRAEVRPWRIAAVRGAKAVLELPAGTAARRGIEPGMRLDLDRHKAEPRAGSTRVDTPAVVAGGLGALLALARFGFT
jgi:uncharacterized protein